MTVKSFDELNYGRWGLHAEYIVAFVLTHQFH